MEFSRQEHWSGFPFPPPGELPDPAIKPASPALAGRFFTTSATWEAPGNVCTEVIKMQRKSSPQVRAPPGAQMRAPRKSPWRHRGATCCPSASVPHCAAGLTSRWGYSSRTCDTHDIRLFQTNEGLGCSSQGYGLMKL